MLRRLLLPLVLLSLAGCGTMMNVVGPMGGEQRVFGGTSAACNVVKENVVAVRQPTGGHVGGTHSALCAGVAAVDVPLSVVGDALTLPITVTAAGQRAINEAVDAYYFPPGADSVRPQVDGLDDAGN